MEQLKLSNFKAIIFDLDGVIYRGETLLPGVTELITRLHNESKAFLFLTNNSAKTCQQVLDKLLRLGLENIKLEQVLTSAVALGLWLKDNVAADSKIFVFGMDGLRHEVESLGFQITEEGDADYVVAGFNPKINYQQLSNASLALRNGAKLLAANLDASIPTEKGLLPGTGALIAALTHPTETKPHVVMGKPATGIYKLATERLGVAPEDTLMIGDRLDTDIAGANNSGLKSGLILTGVSIEEDLEFSMVKPDYILSELSELK